MSPDTLELFRAREVAYRPLPVKSVSDWCEENLTLSSRQTEAPGPFRTSVRPYTRELLECWKDRTVAEVTLCWGAQTAKTTTLMAGLAWAIANDPGPALWIMPTRELARSFSKSRWQPFVEDSGALRQQCPVDTRDMTHLEQHFRSCTLNFIGSNSPASLSSRPIRLLIADELDKFSKQGGRRDEAGAFELAELRTKSYGRSKIFRCSTPTSTSGDIWQRYLAGDQRRWFMPCPHCQVWITYEWKGVKWQAGGKGSDGAWDFQAVRETAHYECPKCAGRIMERDRLSMIRKGEWRPGQAAAMRGERSYHLSSLYSPSEKCSFAALAVKFLRDRGSLTGLQGFVNGELAEPWVDQTMESTRVEVIAPRDAKPLDDAIVVLSVDVQLKSPLFWLVARSWDKAGNSRLVAAANCDDWESVRRLQLTLGIPDNRVVVDSGYNASEVYSRCLRQGRLIARSGVLPLFVGWVPAKSRDRQVLWTDHSGRRPSPWFFSKAALEPGLQAELPLLEWNADYLRDVLQRLRDGKVTHRWERIELPAKVEVPGVVMVDEDVYSGHLDSWHRKPVVVGRRGKVEVLWTGRAQKVADHLLDCELLQVVFASVHRRLNLSMLVESLVAEQKSGAS